MMHSDLAYLVMNALLNSYQLHSRIVVSWVYVFHVGLKTISSHWWNNQFIAGVWFIFFNKADDDTINIHMNTLISTP